MLKFSCFYLCSIVAGLQLTSLSGSALRYVSPSIYDSSNNAKVVAPEATETLYPNMELTKYSGKWFERNTFRYDDAILPVGGYALIYGPALPGTYNLVWSNLAKTKSYSIQVEVSCNDGVHCNGEERFIRGECVPGYLPYQFGTETHQCFESFPWAAREDPNRINDCGPICTPVCKTGRKCGSGGCPVCEAPNTPLGCVSDPNFCGSCNSNTGETCVDGQCIIAPPPSTNPGTCLNTYHLFQNPRSAFYLPGNGGNDIYVGHSSIVPTSGIVGRLVVNDVSGSENNLHPYCNSVENSPEFVFDFEVLVATGFEIMMTGTVGVDIYNGYTGTADTLIAVHKSAQDNCDILRPPTGADYFCSDDATPPGSLGSRISGLLQPGKYTVVASTYAAGAWGPFILWVRFAAEATRPTCDASFCGTDSANGKCGFTQYFNLAECKLATDTCLLGRCSNCNTTFITSSAYKSTCQGKQCGFDQCNLPCGKDGMCDGKRQCDELNKQCKSITFCDPFAPDCSGVQTGRGPTKYCGTDCQWYRVDDKLPDLIAPLESEVKGSINFGVKAFTPEHCGVSEHTINPPNNIAPGTPFTRRMMFFDTNAHNIGESFIPPAFDKRPDMFQWGDCHGHMHFSQFARFLLRKLNGEVASDEALTKLAYCMEDSEPWLKGDNIPCAGTRSCDAQGLSRGYSDYYPGDLDGQWIDLDNPDIPVVRGWYKYEVEVNFGHIIHERAFDNNKNVIYIFIDPQYVTNTPITYTQMLTLGGGCAILPAGISVPECP